MSNKKILIKNTFWLGAIEFFSKILMFLVTIGLVRYWGAEEFGAFNLSFAYVALFIIFADFGLTTIVTREVAKHKDLTEKYLNNLIGLKLILSAVIIILFVISFLFINNPTSIQLLIVTLIYCLAQNFQNIFITIFQAWEKMEMVFINRVLFYVGLLLTAILTITFHGKAIHLVAGYTLVTILTIIIGIYQTSLLKIKTKIEFDFNFCKRLIIESLPLLGMTIATVIYLNNDTLFIGRYLGNTQVGFYQTAYKILFAFQSINFINYAVFPRITVLSHENNHQTVNKLIKIILLLSLIGLIPLAVFIDWQQQLIVKLIYGSSFLISSKVMSLLVWSGVVNYFRNFIGNLLVIKNNQKIVFWAVSIGALTNLVINYFLIPKNGFIQGGWSLIISELLILIIMIIGLRKQNPSQS